MFGRNMAAESSWRGGGASTEDAALASNFEFPSESKPKGCSSAGTGERRAPCFSDKDGGSLERRILEISSSRLAECLPLWSRAAE